MGETNRRSRAEATRQHLLVAAREVFAERGYGGATVAAITDGARTAHGTFYLYFRNKEEVFVHVITDVLEELYQHSFTPIEDLPEQRRPQQSRERIAGFFATFVRHGPLWRAILEGSLASPVVEAHWMEQRLRFHAAVAERLGHWKAAGATPDIDVEVTALALASMVEWTALTSTVFSSPAIDLTDEALIGELALLWDRALGVA